MSEFILVYRRVRASGTRGKWDVDPADTYLSRVEAENAVRLHKATHGDEFEFVVVEVPA